jgi:phenylacetate-CoA ligase
MLAPRNKDERALFDPALQALPAAALAALRAERLSALLTRAGAAIASRYRDLGDVLDALPILTAADLAAEVDAHPPFGRMQLDAAPFIRAALAAGALPRPTPIAWTRADLDAEALLGARALRRSGLGARGRSSDTLDGGLVAPGTLAVSDALDALDALALPVGSVTNDAALQRVVEVWQIVRPEVLIVDAPSFAYLMRATGYDRPRAFAALLTPAHAIELAEPPQLDLYRIFSVPQICSFVAGECAAHDGYHLAEDAVAAEIVSDDAAPVPDGARGRLLLTTLTRSLALLRFDTGLWAELDRTPCSCGETHARLRFA